MPKYRLFTNLIKSTVSIYCELPCMFHCDVLGSSNNDGSWVDMVMTRVTHLKTTPFDPLTHDGPIDPLPALVELCRLLPVLWMSSGVFRI